MAHIIVISDIVTYIVEGIACCSVFTLRMWSAFFEWLLLCAPCDCGSHVDMGTFKWHRQCFNEHLNGGVVAWENFPYFSYGAWSFVAHTLTGECSCYCIFPSTKNNLVQVCCLKGFCCTNYDGIGVYHRWL